ncbi:IS630 family transposase [Actinophytocola oryzae]
MGQSSSIHPAIAARAKAEGGVVVWADQTGLRSDAAPPGRSWAPKGRTPVVRVTGKRLRINVMSAASAQGALWFTVFLGRFTAPVFTAFLDRLGRQAGRKVHVIVDRHPVHRSKNVRDWLNQHSGRVELHLMPSYSSVSRLVNGPGRSVGSLTSSGCIGRRCERGFGGLRSMAGNGSARRPAMFSGSLSWSGKS